MEQHAKSEIPLPLLLPVLGAAAAVLAFAISSPFANTLGHPGMSPNDPRFHFTLGTLWAAVNHFTFGASLCGSFACALTQRRAGWKAAILPTILGIVLGGVVGRASDALSDLVGIRLERYTSASSDFGQIIWCVIVPISLALTIAIVQGPTLLRIKRALIAGMIAIFATWIASQIASIFVGAIIVSAGNADALTKSQAADGGLAAMKASIPIWQAVDIAFGIVFGFIFAASETLSGRPKEFHAENAE